MMTICLNDKKTDLSLGCEIEIFFTQSLTVSVFRAWLLGASVFTQKEQEVKSKRKYPHGVKANVKLKIHCTKTQRIIHTSKTLMSTRDSLFWIHDMEHGSAVTDPTSEKRWISYLSELLVTCFHQAVDYYLNHIEIKYINEGKKTNLLRKASHYTTQEIDRVTLGPYVKYMPVIVEEYIKNLSNFPQLLETVLVLNGYIGETFENLSLNAESGDKAGFCMLPSAINEVFALHQKALEVLYNKMSLDSELKDGCGFFTNLNEEIPIAPVKLFSWDSQNLDENNFTKVVRILKELIL